MEIDRIGMVPRFGEGILPYLQAHLDEPDHSIMFQASPLQVNGAAFQPPRNEEVGTGHPLGAVHPKEEIVVDPMKLDTKETIVQARVNRAVADMMR